MGTEHIRHTGMFDKPDCTQVTEAQVKDLIGCKSDSRVGRQLFAQIPAQEIGGLTS